MSKLMSVLCLFLLCGCPVKAYRGAFVIVQNPKYTLNTKHTCERPAETLRIAELAMPIILQQLEKDGYIKDYAAAVKELAGHVMVCQIPQPEPCCMWKGYCAKPRQDNEGRWARKAGCTVYSSVWVSRNWPPKCWPDWPGEPHCDALEPYNWEWTLVHELLNVAVSMVAGIVQADYNHPIWAKGGTEDKIKAAFLAMRAATTSN